MSMTTRASRRATRRATTNEFGQPTSVTQPKVTAATVGSGVGVAIATVSVWIVEASAQIDVPSTVELAVGVIVTAALTYAAGYMRAPSDKAF